MLRSLSSAVSGMQSQQTFLDTIGNNIANVNTVGFRAATLSFADLLSQQLSNGASATATTGGINPAQVGLGTRVGSVNTVMSQGSLEQTQSPTDLAIQGDGFFVLSDGLGGYKYSRNGSFSIASNGVLANLAGNEVMGYPVNATTGLVDPNQPLQAIKIPIGDQMVAQPSTEIAFSGNLDQRLDATAASPTAKSLQVNTDVYDALGQAHQVSLTFTKTNNATDTWSWTASTTDPSATVSGSGTMAFDPATGAYLDTNGSSPDGTLSLTLTNGAASPVSLNLTFGGITQNAATGNVTGTTDGAAPGAMSNVSISADGSVMGRYSNGQQRLLGQIVTATFPNSEGLLRGADSTFTQSLSSGTPSVGAPSTGERGALNSGYLEMSNVDMTKEFSDMVVAERGFEASSRVFSASDQILQDLVNLRPQ